MIIDCGGGTVDICVHEVVEGINKEDVIREKSIPSGGKWGGMYIDKNFVKFLKDLFTPECIKKVKTEGLHGWYKLMEAFLQAKRNFNSSTPIALYENIKEISSELESIDIHVDIVEKIEEYYNNKNFKDILSERSSKYGGEPVNYRHGQLQITKQTMKSFYTPVIRDILKHLKNLLESNSGCHAVEAFYLVGGFSESTLLQNSIKNMFEPKIKVVVPLGPQTAIIQGAVLYGMQPQIITERVANLTYGIGVSRVFDPMKHDEKYKFKNKEGVDHCNSLFEVLLKKNSIITPLNHEYPITLNLLDKDQTSAEIVLYTTENPNITYTDQGAQIKGKVKHIIPNPEKGDLRHIKVVLDFSGTEVFLIVTNTETDTINYATVDFLCSQF